ncbi:MAG: phage recombination protein Bet [Ruminococcus sp.]|nr:phage recombination protein Bet [Ruminococcus sp.]
MANAQNNQIVIAPVSYETALGPITLTPEDVVNFLARGNSDLTAKEIKMFMELCKFQRLNPFVNEAYPIKFGGDFQMVVGYEAYKRRAEEAPTYRGRKSGIVVLRGDTIVQKEGTCLYPGEKLIGGWCRVFRERNGKEDETFKEVGFDEYNKGQANWKTKPCTMIEKVAVSQALRAAYPKDYEGMYISEEISPVPTVERADGTVEIIDAEIIEPQRITQEQRQALFTLAQEGLGKEEGNALIKKMIDSRGLTSTSDMTVDVYDDIVAEIRTIIESTKV